MKVTVTNGTEQQHINAPHHMAPDDVSAALLDVFDQLESWSIDWLSHVDDGDVVITLPAATDMTGVITSIRTALH